MSKLQPLASLEKNGLPGLSDDNSPFIDWITKNGKTVLYGVLIFLALFFLVYRLSAGKQNNAERDYFVAANEYTLFQNTGNPAALDKLASIMERRPELHAQYDGLIAQKLLNQEEVSEATVYAESAFKRIAADHLPLYQEFAAASLTISDKKYSEALAQALALKQKIKDSPQTADNYLIALNLLRIAMLYEQLEQKQDELKAWNELTSFLTMTGTPLAKPLTFGKLSLADYIEHRQKILKM